MNAGINAIVVKITEQLESKGIPSNIAHVSALETAIETMTDIVGNRDKEIEMLTGTIHRLENESAVSIPTNRQFTCQNTYTCGNPASIRRFAPLSTMRALWTQNSLKESKAMRQNLATVITVRLLQPDNAGKTREDLLEEMADELWAYWKNSEEKVNLLEESIDRVKAIFSE